MVSPTHTYTLYPKWYICEVMCHSIEDGKEVRKEFEGIVVTLEELERRRPAQKEEQGTKHRK